MKKRYTYKLRPGTAAESFLIKEYSRCRWVWNECQHIFSSQRYENTAQLDKMLTEARKGFTWLREGSSVAQQQIIRNFGKAATAFFKGTSGKPKKKKRKGQKISLTYTKRGFSIRDGALKLPHKTIIPVVWSRDLPSEPTSATIYQDSCDDWFVSFIVEVPDPPEVKKPDGKHLGTDFNVSITVVATDSEYDLDFVSQVKKHERNYAKYQKRMAKHREEQKWKSYKNAKRKAAKEKRAEKRKREDRYRKYAKKVAINHSHVAIDDLKVSFMTKTTMAKKTYDASIYTLKKFLQEACDKWGTKYELVNPRNTTQDCSSCGSRAKTHVDLSQRTYHCDNCGLTMCRDRNSAFNVLNGAGFNPTPHEAVRLGILKGLSVLRYAELADGGIPLL